MRIQRVEGRFAATPDGKCAAAAMGMVSAAHPGATAAGTEMLAQGGNAIDAACAVGLALGVCEPQASGLGGQSTGLVHVNGRTFAIDGSSRAPSLAHRSRVSRNACRVGYRATTVPSTPATYAWLQKRYGRLDWPTVVGPALTLAREGYAITGLQHALQRRELETFLSAPSCSGARYFLKDGTVPFPVGHSFRQPQLATVLECLSRHGAEGFYLGDVAEQIDADMREHRGLLRADDLALIPWPIERRPVARRYRGLLVASMPPPGAGRTLLLVLMMLARIKSTFLATREPGRYHFLAETLRKAFLQRNDRPYDPNTYPQIRDKTMISRKLAAELASSIAQQMDTHLPLADLWEDVEETTHFCVMDQEGSTVSMTQSIELVYGAKVAAADLGFLYNNYMLAFERRNPAHPYYLRPNAVPWSSAAPSIVFRQKRPWLAVGSPGSERIFSTVGQFLSRIIDASATLEEAMTEPRLHASVGGRVSLEQDRFDDAVVEHLRTLGYKVDAREPFAFYLGCIHAVLKRQSGDGFQGVADVRRDGTAAGAD